MTYFTSDNLPTTQEELYSALIDLIEPILAEEKEERARLTAEFIEATRLEAEAFDAATAKAHAAAEAALKPLKEELDKKCKAIIERHKRLIDRATAEFGKAQAKLQKEYDAATAPERKIYDEAVAPQRKALEEKLEELGKRLQAQIEPINEEYRSIAAQLEAETKPQLH